MNPFFSVVTVVWNNFSTIERTISSVLSQSFTNFEYIIIDGKSDDGTLGVIKKYQNDSRLKLISEKDSGIYDAMNKGIKLSSGTFIHLLNSDDYYSSNKILETYHNYIVKKKLKQSIIYAKMNLFKENKFLKVMDPYKSYLKKNMRMNHPTWFVSKQIYNKIGNYDTNYKIAADYDFALRCLKSNCDFHQINYPTINFALGGISDISKTTVIESFIVRKNNHHISYIDNYYYLFIEFMDLIKSSLKKIIN